MGRLCSKDCSVRQEGHKLGRFYIKTQLPYVLERFGCNVIKLVSLAIHVDPSQSTVITHPMLCRGGDTSFGVEDRPSIESHGKAPNP